MTQPVNPFIDQEVFMLACGQTVGERNPVQAALYALLVAEEMAEFLDADPMTTDELDAVIDTIVVLIGYAHSCGYDVSAAWGEVMRSNMSKVDPATGKVIRRADGKILKGPLFSPPDLSRFL
jgi:hypothetical protein